MPMNDPKGIMAEYADIADALCNWFKSQEVPPGRAVATMSYLIGIMAAERAVSESGAMQKIDQLNVSAKLMCHAAMQMRRER